jgi:single-stranded DNA-binding protein
MANLEFVVGNVGRSPERKMAGDKQIVEFSIARPTGYGKNAGDPQWFTVAVWDESLRDQALREVRKGETWAVVGPVKTNEYNGKTYKNISAYRLGRVDFLFPKRNEANMFPESSKPRGKTKVEDSTEDDDLDW